MTIGGAVCEFNPFHNGHGYFLENMRSGVDRTVCIMSGSFVQRGEIALCDKYLRAETAVKNGADLVLELPVPYAIAPAETFARGSVGLLNSLGCVDKLFFGAENSLDDIMYAVRECETQENHKRIKQLLNSGVSYPDAVAQATGNQIFDGANNVLAIEYVRQLKSLESEIEPETIKRVGAYHDEKDERDGYLSASAIREKIRKGESCQAFLPQEISDIADERRLETAILSRLRRMTISDLSQIADVNEGLEFRLREAINIATDLNSLSAAVKTKRYTNAKIRRILLCAYLGVTKEMQSVLPKYVRVLASNRNGFEIIKEIKKSSDVTVICRHSDSNALDENDKRLYDFCNMCDDLYSLALPKVRKCGYNQGHKFEVLA